MSVQLGSSGLLNMCFTTLASFPLYPLGKGTCAKTWLRCALKRPSLADCRCATSCRCSQVYLTICLCTFHIYIYCISCKQKSVQYGIYVMLYIHNIIMYSVYGYIQYILYIRDIIFSLEISPSPFTAHLQVKHCRAMIQASVELSTALRVTPLGRSAKRWKALMARMALGHWWHFS